MSLKRFVVFLSLAVLPVLVLAATDQTTIKLTVISNDTDAPSVPAGLNATAASTSQINLSWTASTDNVAVTGYQVFRDSTQIATSTGITYSDTGLSASTAYAYNITAFDAALNVSARSATSTATTDAVAVAPTSGPGPGGGRPIPDSEPPVISDIRISPGLFSVVVAWHTNELAISTLAWGPTPDYGTGSIAESSAALPHETSFDGLNSGTLYYLKISAQDAAGNIGVVRTTFFTLSPPDLDPPANVRNLKAQLTEAPNLDSVKLNWENPLDPDFEAVRVLKSKIFYPRDPYDGEIIYDGPDIEALDRFVKGDDYFYTVFTRDTVGNYSSGAIIKPVRPAQSIEGLSPGFPVVPSPDPEIAALNILDFDFIQEQQVTIFTGGHIKIDSSKGLTISISYDKVPEVLKTIVITLTDPEDTTKNFSFLLRVNANKTAYVSHIGPFGKSGIYPVRITVFDFKNQGVKEIRGELTAELVVIFQEPVTVRKNDLFWLFVLIMILYAWYLRIVHRRGY
jgi:hypothetical protein